MRPHSAGIAQPVTVIMFLRLLLRGSADGKGPLTCAQRKDGKRRRGPRQATLPTLSRILHHGIQATHDPADSSVPANNHDAQVGDMREQLQGRLWFLSGQLYHLHI